MLKWIADKLYIKCRIISCLINIHITLSQNNMERLGYDINHVVQEQEFD